MKPTWWSEAKVDEIPHPCVKITLREEIDVHDGYCSDHGDLEVVEREMILYLPKGNWDFSMKFWCIEAPGHCCCGAGISYTIQSIEDLN